MQIDLTGRRALVAGASRGIGLAIAKAFAGCGADVAICARQSGPLQAASQALQGFGLPEELARSIAGWDVAVSRGELFDDSRQLSGLIRRPTTPLGEAVSEALRTRG